MDTIKAYKVRNKKTGLFSTGGSCPKFLKAGKVWATEGHLKSHLTMLQTSSSWDRATGTYRKVDLKNIDDLEVVVLTYTCTESSTIPLREIAERAAKK